MRRTSAALLSLFAATFATCGSPQSRTGQAGATPMPPELAGLFSRLDEPRVVDDSPPRLVLRDGPEVPEPGRVEMAFPPPSRPDGGAPRPANPGPLRVLSYAPRGSDELIGAVRVTFSQPMVPVASLSDLRAERVPIEIAPLPPGRFRWLGTTTLAFEPRDVRMPLATQYRVRVPAGATSAIGGRLEQPVAFQFDTPPPAVIATLPFAGTTSVELQPTIALRFNQRVDPAVIARATRLEGGGNARLVLLTGRELDATRERNPQLQAWEDDRQVVFKVSEPLRKSTGYTVRVAAGTRGAEGPRPMPAEARYTFRTYDPLRVTQVDCGGAPCRPGSAIRIELNNVIVSPDIDTLIRVEPAVERIERQHWGSTITINGELAPQTTYRVTIRGAIKDVHEQRLGQDEVRSLHFGDTPPSGNVEAQSFATIELDSERLVPVEVVNIPSVRARVAPVPRNKLAQAVATAQRGWGWYRDEDPFRNAGLRPTTSQLRTRTRRNVQDRVGVPIQSAIAAGRSGYALVEVEIPNVQYPQYPQRSVLLVQATDLGLVAETDMFSAVARVSSLSTGAPVAGARVRFGDREARTDAQGVARLNERLPTGQTLVVATHGNDEAFAVTYIGVTQENVIGQVFTDRNPYRPGDTVHIRLIARGRALSPEAGVEPVHGETATCHIRDVNWQERERFEGTLSEFGTLSRDFRIPADAALGAWRVDCSVAGKSGGIAGEIRVEEYRAPEIEVKVRKPDGTFFHRQQPALTVESHYLFGAPAAGLPVRYTIGREAADYSPPGHDGYLFGDQATWRWRFGYNIRAERRHGRSRAVFVGDGAEREIIASQSGTLDEQGRLRVPTKLDPGAIRGPARFVLEAEVTDPSRQSVAGRTDVLAHPASIYVGLRPEKPFVRDDEPIRVRGIVTRIDGAVVAGTRFTARVVERRSRLVVHREGDEYSFDWENVDREVGKCELTSAAEPVECRVAPQRPGTYVVEALATDPQRREARTAIPLYVFGRGWVPWGENEEQLELVPDKTSYRAGDRAHILVRAPFSRGKGLLSIERSGAIETRPIELNGSVQMFDVPITEAHVPSVTVRVTIARGRASREELAEMLERAGADAMRAAAADVGRPAFGSATIALDVDTAPKRLRVDVQPEHRTRGPGESLGVTVHVREPGGRPARAEVTIMAVDEGVLSLLGYETPDPVDSLHQAVGSTLGLDAVHGHIIRRRKTRALQRPGDTREAEDRIVANGHGRGGGGGRATRASSGPPPPASAQPMAGALGDAEAQRADGGESAGSTRGEIPASARTLFATTAFYRAASVTDADGVARVRFNLPDNLTTFRIMAVAVAPDDKTGSGESKVQVRKRIVLRPAMPRFATFGDRFDAAVVVHNETGRAQDEVVVGIRAAGMSLAGANVQRLRMRVGEAKRVTFPVRVEAGGGKARIQFAASAQGGSDAVELDLPLVEPATSEAFATYGSVTDGALRLPVRVPRNVIDRWGRLEVTLSSTALTSLDDAAEYLFDYPYVCAEQMSSRLVAASALREVLTGRSDRGRWRADQIARDSIAALLRHQRGDGGFVYWPGSPETELYVSAWVTFALGEAKRAGFQVPADALERAYRFLDNRVENPNRRLGEDRAFAVQALALYALAEGGKTPRAAHLTRVWSHRNDLPLFGKAWLIRAMRSVARRDSRAEELWRQIENAAAETPAGAHFGENRVESARLLWHSERRSDAIILAMMLERDGDHPLVEKTARGLIAARRDGAWHTTQENAWALAALVRYYRVRERVVPDMTVQAWLGESFVGQTEFRGRTGRIMSGSVPMAALREMGSGDLVVAPHGEGRLYYRIGMRYAPSEFRLPPEEQGFAVTRVYEAIEHPDDVRRDGDGVWHVKAEANVRVRVTLVIPDDRYDVAVDDPLPAGLEAVNMAFQTTATQRLSTHEDERRYDMGNYWALFAFEHREMRDDRVVAFARHAPAGVYELTYIARATTTGRFIATSTKAEEMYAPEVFGRAASDVVVVEDRQR